MEEEIFDNECVFFFFFLSKFNTCQISCGHIFHYVCVQTWINTTKNITKLCPLCNNNGEIINIQTIEELNINNNQLELENENLANENITNDCGCCIIL